MEPRPLSRRDLVRLAAWLGLSIGTSTGLGACATSGAGAAGPSLGTSVGTAGTRAGAGAAPSAGVDLALSRVARATPATAAQGPAVAAITGFTERMVAEVLARQTDNLICSPYSVAAALAMTANGARGTTAQEMLTVLGGLSIADLDAGLAVLSGQFMSRAGRKTKADGNAGEIALDIANSLWGQRGTTWEQPFLDELARWFGAGMNLVDFVGATESARARINDWTAAATHDKILDLVPAGALDVMTRLVLVNAVYLKAPWEEPFQPSATRKGSFTLASGARVEADLMHNAFEGASAAVGSGYVAISLPYAGRELAMTLVLPDRSDPASLASWLRAGGLGTALAALAPRSAVTLTLPKWTFRTRLELRPLLSVLGMPSAFGDAADFSGIARSVSLTIDEVYHQGFVAVDEEGTEASAATAVVMREVAVPADPLSVVLDRPFLFVVHDIASRAPLFVGRVADPTR